jgi:transcriptional regulator with XRE-family HTH domain
MAIVRGVATPRGHDAADRNDAILLGRFIARARKSKGLTQVALARRLGLSSQSAVSEWERGSVKPDVSMWPRIAHELSINVHDMGEVIWGPWNRNNHGQLVSFEDLAALLSARANELRRSARDSDEPGGAADEEADSGDLSAVDE